MWKRWKDMKRWKKWTVSITFTLVFIILCASGYLYFVIKQIDIVDIEKRIEERKNNPEVGDEGKVPGVIGATVDKASSLAGKSIDSQDALDVAAILLKSGLSMKEIYYLMGKSTDKLNNEEKQNIRDLLLSKLSDIEINALRNITIEYGKALIILDPNYPIELVGIYDEDEQERIKQELNERNSKVFTPTPTPTPVAEIEDSLETPAPTIDSGEEAAVLRDLYQSKLDSLKQSCSNKVSTIANEIAADLNTSKSNGNGLSIAALQSKYLPKIESAENGCDTEFQQLISNAQNAYTSKSLPLSDIEIWKSQYDKAKQEARNQAMNTLMNSL